MHQIKSVSTEKATDITDKIKIKIKELESENNQVDFYATGFLVFLKEFVSMVIQSSILSIFISIIAIAIITFWVLKKYYWSLLSIIPLSTAVILNFGIMGILGIELSHLTALLAAIIIASPSFTTAIIPPTAASGPTWPIQKPLVPPENRPSVIKATVSPNPCP